VVRLLLAAGADVNARDQDGETPLTLAARDASEAVVRALLAAGGEVAYRNANRATAEDIAKGLNRGAVAGLLAAK
jgi:ankyrin repeat protein